ncbi:LamG domain-containing protein [Flavobacterium lindanitolerans]|nr:LamG domain-containing protein [Flavobacterium lindanitolerans]
MGQVVVSLPKSSLTSNFTKTATQEYVLIVSSTSAFGSNDIVDIIPLTDTGSNYEVWYDFDGTKFFSFGVSNQFDNKYRLDNQTGDFVLGEKNINLNSSFTVSGWVRHTSGGGTVLAKSGAYQFYINGSNKLVGNWNGGDRITSTTSVNNGKWHYVAVAFNSGTASLYIDGVLDATATGQPTPVSNTANFSIGAMWSNKSAISSVFSGDIDEIRIWNSALTAAQIRYIMNQEIEKNGTNTYGKVIPNTITKNDIASIPWNNLQAYYDLNTFYGTSIKDKSDNNRWARIKYLTVDKNIVATQTAPLPYVSATDGAWATTTTWTNGNVQELPNNVSIVNAGIPVDWNIVQTSHNVTSVGNKTLLGLNVSSNTLSAQNDTKIEVSHYLKVNGKIDLVGKSQLIQTLNSDLDPTSSGALERDQQGTSNKYNYNYWCSPVSTQNATTNNIGYTINGVLRDGTTSTPQTIMWTSGTDGAPGSPITLSSKWLYKFQSASNNYANWIYVGHTGGLLAAQGFTMKGSGAATPTQNYTFVGKPNNGRIQYSIGPNLLNLTGNPYPSALDATAFINDNLATTTGTLYFWDHFGGETHVLLSYLGGYAARNLIGGVVAMSQPELQDVGPVLKSRTDIYQLDKDSLLLQVTLVAIWCLTTTKDNSLRKIMPVQT